MTLHLNTQADLDDAIHALVKQDPRLQTGIRSSRACRRCGGASPVMPVWRRSSAASNCPPRARRRSGPASAPRSIRFTTTRCAAPAPTASAGSDCRRAKIKTLKNLARELAAERLNLDVLANEDADAAHNTLTALHGIGPWTADVYLLFCLGHGDAWPAGDLAVQEAVKIGLGLKTRPTREGDGAAGGAVASAARRRGASVVDLLPGAEEARRRDRRTGKNERCFKQIACRKTDISEGKDHGSENAGIEKMNSTDFIVARDDLQQCKIDRDAAARRRRNCPTTRC